MVGRGSWRCSVFCLFFCSSSRHYREMKKFNEWNTLKKSLNAKDTVPNFKEREIWWCSLGVNVGHEQDGKNAECSRPVLIVKKFNKRLFWGVPLTTQIKDSPHYHRFTFKNRPQCAMLTQLRLWDANRITNKMGQLGRKEFKTIRASIAAYLKYKSSRRSLFNPHTRDVASANL